MSKMGISHNLCLSANTYVYLPVIISWLYPVNDFFLPLFQEKEILDLHKSWEFGTAKL